MGYLGRYAALIILLASPCLGSAANIYISASGGTFSGGTACNGKIANTPSFFNTASNWGVANTQIGQDTTVWVCGTITGSAGNSVLSFQAAGASGHPITLKFDMGAKIQASYFGKQNSSAIVTTFAYTVIDGNNLAGIVQATLNGTIGGTCPGGTCTANQPSSGVYLAADNTTVKNLQVLDMYDRSSTSDSYPGCGCNDGAIIFLGAGNNVVISGNKIVNVRIPIGFNWGAGATGGQIANNTIVAGSTMIEIQTTASGTYGTLYVYGNHSSNFCPWDGTTTSEPFHNQAIHTFIGNGGGTNGVITNLYYYNNEADQGGPCSLAQATGQLYFENTGAAGTNGAGAITNLYAFNNIVTWSNGDCAQSCGSGGFGVFSGGTNVYAINNTVSCNANGTTPQAVGFGFDQAIHVTRMENNIATSCDGGKGNISIGQNGAVFAASQPDYNIYANGGGVGFSCGTNQYAASGAGLTSFKTCANFSGSPEAHSSYNASANLSSAFVPNSGSPAIGVGLNLYSFAGCASPVVPGLGALCNDKNGNARSVSGAWDAGALNSNTTSVAIPVINPPTGSYPSPATITISDGTSGVTICFTTDNSAPTANGAGTCTHGTTYSAGFSQAIPATVKAIASKSGLSDSGVSTNTYLLPPPTVTPTSAPSQFVFYMPTMTCTCKLNAKKANNGYSCSCQ